jgi:hypothetical protein
MWHYMRRPMGLLTCTNILALRALVFGQQAEVDRDKTVVISFCFFDWACSPVVRRSSGMLRTRVQILMLAPFLFQDLPAL